MQICSAIRPAIRSAISAAIISAFCARAVAGPLLGQLFPLTAPGVTNPGYAFDYSDLTEEKLAWRKNLLTYTEQFDSAVWSKTQVGVAGLPVLTAAYSAAPDGTMTAQRLQMTLNGSTSLADYCTLHQFYSAQIGRTFSHGVWLKTNDGTTKVLIYRDDNAQTVNKPITVTPVWQRFTAENGVAVTASLNACRLWLRGAQGTADSVDLSIWGAQLNVGPALLDYQKLSDVSSEFLATFPNHALFRDITGAVACYQLEDPCGLALDMRFGGARSVELAVNGTFDVDANWNKGSGWAITGGRAVRSPIASGSVLSQAYPLIAGRLYEIGFDCFNVTGTFQAALRGVTTVLGTNVVTTNFTGRYTTKIFAVVGGTSFDITTSSANFSGEFDNYTIKEVYGNHAVQATAGDRPIISSKYNQLPNSAWQGGGTIPTGWTQPVAAATTATAGVDGNTVYRFPAAAARAFFAAPLVSLALGQVMSLGVTVEAIASGSVPVQDTVIFAPSSGAGTNAFYADGVLVAASAPVAVGQRVVCVTTCTTAGTFIPRAGAGCSGNATVDISLSRPAVTAGGVASVGRYQRTNADGTYDYAGFLIGARGNGINSSMSIPSLNLSASQRAILASAVMKMGDATRGIVQEHTGTASNSGSFNIEGPFGPNQGNFRFALSGSPGNGAPASSLVSGYPAPALAVLQSSLDTSQAAVADAVRSRVNGVEAGSKSGSTGGTANLANDAHYLWRRGSATGVNFDGFIYRAICRGGDFDATTNSLADRWLNERVKAFA